MFNVQIVNSKSFALNILKSYFVIRFCPYLSKLLFNREEDLDYRSGSDFKSWDNPVFWTCSTNIPPALFLIFENKGGCFRLFLILALYAHFLALRGKKTLSTKDFNVSYKDIIIIIQLNLFLAPEGPYPNPVGQT